METIIQEKPAKMVRARIQYGKRHSSEIDIRGQRFQQEDKRETKTILE